MATVDILIRARDESTPTLQAVQRQVEQSSQAMGRSFAQAGQATAGFSRQVSGASASARFLGFTVINELSPALGTGASRLASLASVATLGGSAMTALAVIGVGGLVVALSSYIKSTREAREEQEKLNKVIAQGEAAALAASLRGLRQQEFEARNRLDELRERLESQLQDPFEMGVAAALTARQIRQEEDRLRQVGANIARVRREVDATSRSDEAEADEKARDEKNQRLQKALEEQERFVRRSFDDRLRLTAEAEGVLTDQQLAFSSDVAQKLLEADQNLARERLEVEAKAAGERQRFAVEAESEIGDATLPIFGEQFEQRLTLLDQHLRLGFSLKESEARADLLLAQRTEAERLALLREALDGQRELALMHADLMARHGRDAGEQFAGGIQSGILIAQEQMGTFGHNVQDIVVGSAQAWARGMDDAFFNVITGRTKKLADVFKQMGEAILRELTGSFARLATGNILRQLESAFGLAPGRLWGFSPAALGAIIPGVGGIPGIGAGAGVMPGVDGVAGVQTAAQVAATFGFGAGGFAPGTAAAQEAAGLGGLFTTQAPGAPGLGLAQALGGWLAIAGGVLALASTFQQPNVALGAFTGALGGLGIGLGLSALGLGAAAVLGPIGLAIGLGIGIFGARHGRNRARSAERARQNVQLGEQRIAELEALLGTSAARGAFAEHPFLVELVLDVGRVMRFQSSNTDNARVLPFRFFLDAAVDMAKRFVAGTASAADVASTVHASFNRGDVDQFPMSVTLSASGAIWIQRLLSQGVSGFLAAELQAVLTGVGLPEGFTPPEVTGGFLIQEALAPGITRFEALAGIGPRERGLAIAGIRRNALVQLINAAGPEELEFLLARLREFAELTSLPILPQARFIEVLG